MGESILIVDDDQSARTAICRWAEKRGYGVSGAESAEQALNVVEQRPVDLVITDLVLPGMDGLSLAETLLERDPDRPVLLITAYGNLDTARRAVKIGIHEYVAKPFVFKDLQASVRRALEHRRSVQEDKAHQTDLERQVEQRIAELSVANQQLAAANQQLEEEITERRTVEEALRESERLYRGAIEANGVIVLIDNLQVDAYEFVSEGIEDLTGYSSEEFS